MMPIERTELQQLIAAGHSRREMATICRVHLSTITKWLNKHGLSRPYEQYGRALKEDNPNLLYKLAPRRGRKGACSPNICSVFHTCREMDRSNLWVLCQAPDRDHVQRLVADGRLPQHFAKLETDPDPKVREGPR